MNARPSLLLFLVLFFFFNSSMRSLYIRPAAAHILSLRGGLLDHLCLPLITRIAPHFPLFAVQQVSQHVAVRDQCCKRAYRMRHIRLRVHADMRLQPEVLLLAFARLAHRPVTLFLIVLSR